MKWFDRSKAGVNLVAGLAGLRVVNANWGPRGVTETLKRAKKGGVNPRLIFDVGASNGQWTKDCMKVFPDASYVLIDPLEENRDLLLNFSRKDERVAVWFGAVGATAGQMNLFEHGDQSSLLASDDFRGPARLIDVITLDALFADHGKLSPVLLKADVQGYEMEVLRGASKCLRQVELLILEVSFREVYAGSPLAHEVISYVGEQGFRIYDICSYVQRHSDGELIQSDIMFLRESSSIFQYHGWK